MTTGRQWMVQESSPPGPLKMASPEAETGRAPSLSGPQGMEGGTRTTAIATGMSPPSTPSQSAARLSRVISPGTRRLAHQH